MEGTHRLWLRRPEEAARGAQPRVCVVRDEVDASLAGQRREQPVQAGRRVGAVVDSVDERHLRHEASVGPRLGRLSRTRRGAAEAWCSRGVAGS